MYFNKKIVIIYNSFKKLKSENKIVLNKQDLNIIYTEVLKKGKILIIFLRHSQNQFKLCRN